MPWRTNTLAHTDPLALPPHPPSPLSVANSRLLCVSCPPTSSCYHTLCAFHSRTGAPPHRRTAAPLRVGDPAAALRGLDSPFPVPLSDLDLVSPALHCGMARTGQFHLQPFEKTPGIPLVDMQRLVRFAGLTACAAPVLMLNRCYSRVGSSSPCCCRAACALCAPPVADLNALRSVRVGAVGTAVSSQPS